MSDVMTWQAEIVIQNLEKMHARPAAAFVNTAAAFESDIRLQNLSRYRASHDAKSLTDVLLAAIEIGHRIRLTTRGHDALEAIKALAAHVADPEPVIRFVARSDLGNSLRLSHAYAGQKVYGDLPSNWPTEIWQVHFWSVRPSGELKAAQVDVRLPAGYEAVCGPIHVGEQGCVAHARRWGVACSMSRLAEMGFDPTRMPTPPGGERILVEDTLHWMMEVTHVDLPGEFIIASSEHPFLLFDPAGKLVGSDQNWYTYLGALAYYVSQGAVTSRFARLWQENQRLYQQAVVELLTALGGQDDAQSTVGHTLGFSD